MKNYYYYDKKSITGLARMARAEPGLSRAEPSLALEEYIYFQPRPGLARGPGPGRILNT